MERGDAPLTLPRPRSARILNEGCAISRGFAHSIASSSHHGSNEAGDAFRPMKDVAQLNSCYTIQGILPLAPASFAFGISCDIYVTCGRSHRRASLSGPLHEGKLGALHGWSAFVS